MLQRGVGGGLALELQLNCSMCTWGRTCAHVHVLSLWLPHRFVHRMGVRTRYIQPGPASWMQEG
eukprot:12917085-Prorocentrum_lima.AAC.1